jgi:hypothetical protein
MRLLLATVLALALGVGPLIAGGAGATTNSADDKAASAPRADFSGLVDIGGGRKMYMKCRGTGSPTVVLVSGSPGSVPMIVPEPCVRTTSCPLPPR